MKRIALAVLTSGLTLLPAASAAAHAEVSHLTPRTGSAVKRSTSTVGLRFSEGVLGGKLKVTDAHGKRVSSGSRLTRGKTRLRARLSLHRGRFTVKATWVADDGDKQSKRWSFTAK